MKTPCLKCGLIHDEPTAICDAYVGLDVSDDIAAINRKKAVERIRAVLASVPVEARSTGRARAAAASVGAGARASSAPASTPGPVRPAIAGSAVSEPPTPSPEVPEWRREVTERLESYRSRRERQRNTAGQSVLTFRVHSKTDTLEAEPEAAEASASVAPITDAAQDLQATFAPSALIADAPPTASAAQASMTQAAGAVAPTETEEALRVYAPMEAGISESHSEQVFAAAMDAVEAPAAATLETEDAPRPAMNAVLPIPAEPPVVLADSATLEVHADPAELAEVQTVPPAAAPAASLTSAVEAAPSAAMPAIDTGYWKAQPDAVTADGDDAELECGSLTSGFEIGNAPAEERVMDEEEPVYGEAPVTEAVAHDDEAVSAEHVVSESLAATDSEVLGATTAEPVGAESFAAAASDAPEFAESLAAATEEETEDERRRVALRTAARPPVAAQPERMEISVPQPVFDFSAAAVETQQPQDQGLPVADLRERRTAAILDAVILALTVGGFFLAFHLAGGEFAFSRTGAAVAVAATFLIYAQYVLLFTVVGGGTPGMALRGLRVVCFDGKPPDQTDLTWRGFGYLISAAAGALGFLWSAWDEHGLTWHDRISQTYITYAEPVIAEVAAPAS